MGTPVTTAYSTLTMTPVKMDSVSELRTTACGAPFISLQKALCACGP